MNLEKVCSFHEKLRILSFLKYKNIQRASVNVYIRQSFEKEYLHELADFQINAQRYFQELKKKSLYCKMHKI